MQKKLILENSEGRVTRTFHWQGEPLHVVQRLDTKRLELVRDTEDLKANKIEFNELGSVDPQTIGSEPLKIGTGRLKLVEVVGEVVQNQPGVQHRNWYVYALFFAILVLNGAFLSFIMNRGSENTKLTEELKQQVVQIVKRIPVKPASTVPQPMAKAVENETKPQQQVTKRSSNAIKRMGALAVLGSLSKSKQRGGVDLGAVNTTAGPGLGGTQGSGGAQTSLYGRGLMAAPVGAGGNMQGGGGYGTKGKGGGQAGYGKLSMIGSAGNMPIPLGKEAIVANGLDPDLINDVINRNMGQVRFCYEQALQADPSLNGRVAVNFTIGGDGVVRAANVSNTTLNSSVVEECVVRRLKSWKFPLPEGGVDVKVSYPFAFRRSGQG